MKEHIKAEIRSYLEEHLNSSIITASELLEMVHNLSENTINKNVNNQTKAENKTPPIDDEDLFTPLKAIIGNIFQ